MGSRRTTTMSIADVPIESPVCEPDLGSVFPLRVTPWEKYFLIDDRREYPMTFVIHFHLTGELDRDAFVNALHKTLRKHPLLMSTVAARSPRRWDWVYRPELEPNLRWLPLSGDSESYEVLTLNPFQQPGFAMIVRADRQRAEISAVFHHACTDGIGAMGMLGELCHMYVQLCPRAPQTLRLIHDSHVSELRNREPAPDDRLGSTRGWARLSKRCRILCKDSFTALEIVFRLPSALVPGAIDEIAADPLTFPGILRTATTPDVYKRLRQVTRKFEVSFHSVLAAGLFKTVRDWNVSQNPGRPGHYIRLLLPANLRLSDQLGLPAANCMSYAFTTRHIRNCDSFESILRGLHDELEPVWRERRALRFLEVLQVFAPHPKLMRFISRRGLSYATVAFSYLGSPGALMNMDHDSTSEGHPRVGELVLTDVAGAPPLRPGMRASFSAWTHNGILNLAVRCDPRYFSRRDADRLLNMYRRNLEAIGVPPG
jgi:hypothetical protein